MGHAISKFKELTVSGKVDEPIKGSGKPPTDESVTESAITPENHQPPLSGKVDEPKKAYGNPPNNESVTESAITSENQQPSLSGKIDEPKKAYGNPPNNESVTESAITSENQQPPLSGKVDEPIKGSGKPPTDESVTESAITPESHQPPLSGKVDEPKKAYGKTSTIESATESAITSENQQPPLSVTGRNDKCNGPRSETSSTEASLTDGSKKFNWSVDAEEFVPGLWNVQVEDSHAAPTTTKCESSMENNGEDVVPFSTDGSKEDSYDKARKEISKKMLLKHVTNVVFNLAAEPHEFGRSSSETLKMLQRYLCDGETLRAIVELLVNQSIENINFRYSGARMCYYLANNDLGYSAIRFDDLLYEIMSKEFKRSRGRMKLKRNVKFQNRRIGVMLFMVELHLLFCEDEKSSRAYEFGAQTIRLMNEQMRTYLPENIKAVCKALKLVGWNFQHSPNDQLARLSNGLFSTMKDMSTNNSIGNDMKTVIRTILELKKTKWNKEKTDEPSSSATGSSSASVTGSSSASVNGSSSASVTGSSSASVTGSSSASVTGSSSASVTGSSSASVTGSYMANSSTYQLTEYMEFYFNDDEPLLDDEEEGVLNAYEEFLKDLEKSHNG